MRLLVVGTHHGANYLSAAKTNPHWEIAGIVARSEEHRLDAGKKFGIDPENQFASLETALDNLSDLDAVAITTPNDSHSELGTMVLEHDLHLIMEKPLTENWEESVEWVKILDQHPSKKAMVGQTARGDYNFRMMEYQLRQGLIGNIEQLQCSAHWWWVDDSEKSWRFTLPNMWLEDIGIHNFDTIRMLLGNPKCLEVFCKSSCPNSYPLKHMWPTASGILSFENNVVVNYFGSMAAKGERTEYPGIYKIFGDEGCMVKPTSGEPYALFNLMNKKVGLDSEFGDEAEEFLPYIEYSGIAYLMEDFYHAIMEDRAPVTDLHDNLNSHAILMAMKKSAIEKRLVDVQTEFPI